MRWGSTFSHGSAFSSRDRLALPLPPDGPGRQVTPLAQVKRWRSHPHGHGVGLWNSLHSRPAGSAGPSGRMWYESDFYSSLTLDFAGALSLGTTYTAYMSPNSSFGRPGELAGLPVQSNNLGQREFARLLKAAKVKRLRSTAAAQERHAVAHGPRGAAGGAAAARPQAHRDHARDLRTRAAVDAAGCRGSSRRVVARLTDPRNTP